MSQPFGPQPPRPYPAPCGCRVWPGYGTRPGTLEINPACLAHGRTIQRPGGGGSSTAVIGVTIGVVVLLLIIFAILVGVYVAFHNRRYAGCTLLPPGLFEWPKACI